MLKSSNHVLSSFVWAIVYGAIVVHKSITVIRTLRTVHSSIRKFLLSRMRYRQIEGFRLNYFVKVTILNCRHSMTRMITLFWASSPSVDRKYLCFIRSSDWLIRNLSLFICFVRAQAACIAQHVKQWRNMLWPITHLFCLIRQGRANAAPTTINYTPDSPDLDERRGQPHRSAMVGPRPGGTTFVIIVTSAPSKFNDGTIRMIQFHNYVINSAMEISL